MILSKKREIPKFREGETVRVKSRDAVLKSIDSTNKLDGYLFTNQMWDYCGNAYRVLRAGTSFFNEHQHRTFRPRAPFYMLENLICKGEVDHFPFKCDHSCFFLWHEDWLEKVQ